MARSSQIIFICLTAMIILFFASGCQEEQQSDSLSPKRAKLIASENMKLEEKLDQKDKQISELEDKLEQCQQERDKLKEKSQKGIEQISSMLLETIGQENAELKKENKKLKAKIEELQQQ